MKEKEIIENLKSLKAFSISQTRLLKSILETNKKMYYEMQKLNRKSKRGFFEYLLSKLRGVN